MEPALIKEYKLQLDEEYEFYSQPVSQTGSWVDLTGEDEKKEISKSITALNDPIVRRQIANQKAYLPWFLGLITFAQVIILGVELYFNWASTGSVLQTNPFNYMIGPHSGVNEFHVDSYSFWGSIYSVYEGRYGL